MTMTCMIRSFALVALVLSSALPGQSAVDEFKKYIRSKEPEVRRDQVERMARVNTVEAASLLMAKGLTDPEYSVREKASWALAQFTAEAREAVFTGLSSPKPAIREGVCMAIGQMKASDTAIPLEKLGGMITGDRSELVRAAAAESLGMLGHEAAVPYIVKGLKDRQERVVIACADALGLIKDERAGEHLIPLLDHPSWRAQVAALSAMAKVRSKVTIGPIIEYMDVANGRSRDDAHRALKKITARTFGMKTEPWREWWNRIKDDEGWKVPPEPKKVEVKAVPGGSDGYGRSKPTRYHRITTYSKRIIFVIDISNSMTTPILVKEGKDTKGNRLSVGVPKMSLAREELKRTLEGMDSDTWFNVIAFETDVRQFKKKPVRASPGNIQQATRWLEKQKPRGLAGGVTRRPSSGVDKHGWVLGKTNTYGALAAVYGLKIDHERGGVRTTTAPSPGTKRRPRWDTCFFLSDGRPTVGVVTDIELILQDVKRWNKTCKMVIHCIGMEKEQGLANLLHGLGRITGGEVVFLGK